MELKEYIKTGDVILCDRLLYKHFGIYAGNGRVIHYAAGNADFGNDVCVRETSLKQFTGDGEYEIARFEGNQCNSKRFSPKETVRRARSRIGEKSYNLLFNNCEHFALWCKYGTSKSVQVEKAVTTAAVLGAVAVITYIAVKSEDEG